MPMKATKTKTRKTSRSERHRRPGQVHELPNGRWIVAKLVGEYSVQGIGIQQYECPDTATGEPVRGTLPQLMSMENVVTYASRNGAHKSILRFEREAGC